LEESFFTSEEKKGLFTSKKAGGETQYGERGRVVKIFNIHFMSLSFYLTIYFLFSIYLIDSMALVKPSVGINCRSWGALAPPLSVICKVPCSSGDVWPPHSWYLI
jgi:hypothetical protein